MFAGKGALGVTGSGNISQVPTSDHVNADLEGPSMECPIEVVDCGKVKIDLTAEADDARVSHGYLHPVWQVQVLLTADVGINMLYAQSEYSIIDLFLIWKTKFLELLRRDDLVGLGRRSD